MCPSCGTKFYDMGRVPVTCPVPECGAAVAAEPAAKARRGTATVAPPKPKPAVAPQPIAPTPKPDDGHKPAAEAAEPSDDREGKPDLIEDVRELGEDEDDMAEVLEGTVPETDES